MSKEIKDQIESIEEETQTRIDLEQQFDALSEEVIKLKSIIEEQNVLIEQQDKIESNIPPDVQILKDMIIKKRQEIEEKENEIEALTKEIISLRTKIESFSQQEPPSEKVEELENARQLLLQLTEENKLYKLNEENSKKIVKQMMETNEDYKKEIEVLKSQSQSHTPDIERLNELVEEKKRYKAQIEELTDRVQTLEASLANATSKTSEEDLREELELLKEKNNQLRKDNFLLNKKLEKARLAKEAPKTISHEPIEKEYKEFLVATTKLGAELDEESTVKPSEILALQKELGNAPIEDLETEDITEKIASVVEKELLMEKAEFLSPLESGTSSGFEAKKETLIVSDADGHRRCPACGNTNRNKIHEELDKTNIIMAYPRMYGKKYRCGQCGTEWKLKTEM